MIAWDALVPMKTAQLGSLAGGWCSNPLYSPIFHHRNHLRDALADAITQP